MTSSKTFKFAYYCSGHGFGHATRLSSFVTHLFSLAPRPTIYIVSSAPKHIFSEIIDLGAMYRYVEIDPVVVQPLAYHVDRQKSIEVLKNFLMHKQLKIEEEVRWLRETGIECVLSDAAFLACMAAKSASVPSVLVTNFTFDSVYSYLCSPKHNTLENSLIIGNLKIETDLLHSGTLSTLSDVEYLIQEMRDGYLCADRLLLLPGHIPIPSFHRTPHLPAYDWVNISNNSFSESVMQSFAMNNSYDVLSVTPSFVFNDNRRSAVPRQIVYAPLLVRPYSEDIFEVNKRKNFLESICVPKTIYENPVKILLVSFGGQIIRKPSSRGSTTPRSGADAVFIDLTNSLEQYNEAGITKTEQHHDHALKSANQVSSSSSKIVTSSHIWVPGAPPAIKTCSPSSSANSKLCDIDSPTSMPITSKADTKDELETLQEPSMLPDASWIAIVCGVPSGWGRDNGEELPDNFYIAPKNVYMPDLTAIADVLLGKLGYGTVSECINACTPLVYVPRPLFIEEYGLRLLLQREGVGVEMPREKYEAGDWSQCIREAWIAGKAIRERREIANHRVEQGRQMAQDLVNWVEVSSTTQQEPYSANE